MPFRAVIFSIFLLFAAGARADDDALTQGPAFGEPQLQPYFNTPSLKSALSEYQAGRAASALKFLPAQLPKDSPAPVRWLKALALRAVGQPGPARKIFETLVQGPLADRALYQAALCAVDQGDGASAEKLLSQVSTRYVDADQALLERARQAMKARVPGPRTAEAVEQILAPIFSGAVRADVAQAHVLAGDAQAAAGSRDAARAHFRAAWVERPLSAASDGARQRDRALGAGAPPPAALLVKRAELLLDAHRNKEALDQLAHLALPSLCLGGCPGDRTPAALVQAALALLAPDALPAPHEPTAEDVARNPVQPADPLACRAKLDQGRAYRKEHEYAKARAALAPVILRCAEPDTRARALYLTAQLESMAGRSSAALWEALARKYPDHSLADDALFNQALAERRLGNAERERELLRELVNGHLDADTRAEAIFRLFWSFFAEGKSRQGLAYLDQLAAHPDADGADEERARYWRARVLLDPAEGESELAKAAAREVARADLIWLITERPLTYHGLIARGRLEELDPARAAAIEAMQGQELAESLKPGPKAPLHAGALARDPHLLAAVELIRLGLKQEASRELSAVDRSPARNAGEAGTEPLALLAELYSRAGDFRNAHALVRTDLRGLLRRPASALAMRAAALAYPLAFRELISKASHSSAIPADLLQALMREESALDPRALSSTGALGLTQVMPATARMVAHKLKLRGYQTIKLFEPETNIRIGGEYLGELYKRFQHPALALASYNAGPGAVAGWLRARGTLPLDAFVEEIPLDETRGYVKRCLRSFAAYQFLYGNGRVVLPSPKKTLAVN